MPITSVVLIVWIPVCSIFFAVFRPVKAVTLAYLVGWLLLPVAKISIQGFWDIDKILATNVGVVLGTLLFCPKQFKGYRASVPDFLLLALAASTCVTSVLNGLGVYDGLSSFCHKLFFYAMPFWAGRLFLKNRSDLHESARLIVCGAALYAVLAVWEWRMSPQIHTTLYGYFQHSWGQHVRWGFYRPIVCFPHALALGTFFSWTSLIGFWLWRNGQFRPVAGIPSVVGLALPLLGLLTTMSFGPYATFTIGLGLLVLWKRTGWRWLILAPAVFSILWMTGRYTEVTDGRWFSSAVAELSEKRADSLQYRINAESLLLQRAKQKPIFGWGGWGRNRVTDEHGRDLVATDGLWIIFVGSYGIFGLGIFYLWWCWPILMGFRLSRKILHEPVVMALLVASGIQAMNFLFNGHLSPILTVLCGGVVTILAAWGDAVNCRMGVANARRRSGAPGLHSVRLPRITIPAFEKGT